MTIQELFIRLTQIRQSDVPQTVLKEYMFLLHTPKGKDHLFRVKMFPTKVAFTALLPTTV